MNERKPARDWGPTMYRVAAALGVVVVWALDTFTVQGFLTALYLEPTTDGLLWPAATRVAWWVLFYLAGSAFVGRLMWREAVLTFTSNRQLWAASHVSAVKRLTRRTRWWAKGIRAAYDQWSAGRPAVVVPDVSRPVSRTVPDVAAAAAA